MCKKVDGHGESTVQFEISTSVESIVAEKLVGSRLSYVEVVQEQIWTHDFERVNYHSVSSNLTAMFSVLEVSAPDN
jgi:hypothetical protein